MVFNLKTIIIERINVGIKLLASFDTFCYKFI